MSSASNIRGDATISKIKKAFRDNLCCGLGRLEAFATKHDIYVALALTVRDRLLQRTVESVQAYIARLLPCGVAC
jgi:glycogen phosphorylase